MQIIRIIFSVKGVGESLVSQSRKKFLHCHFPHCPMWFRMASKSIRPPIVELEKGNMIVV